ncbi:MAG: DUF3276 family protein [Bacteroidetes bacterium]|nr:DUF3276 family protein [Bacteroidota bacterium]
MEYGHFKRKDGNFRDRDKDRDRDRPNDFRDRGNDRGGFNRDRGGDYRDRGNDRGGFNRDRGGFRDRNDFRDRGDRSDREPEESVFSKRVRAGKRRTYFFDVRKTKGNDFFITITESTRREDGYGYKRHKIFLYKEDFNRFVTSLTEVVNHVKTDLMPDFDYEEFDRRQAEWEAQNRDFDEDEDAMDDRPEMDDAPDERTTPRKEKDDDEMSW